jgi:hypothetical protein
MDRYHRLCLPFLYPLHRLFFLERKKRCYGSERSRKELKISKEQRANKVRDLFPSEPTDGNRRVSPFPAIMKSKRRKVWPIPYLSLSFVCLSFHLWGACRSHARLLD